MEDIENASVISTKKERPLTGLEKLIEELHCEFEKDQVCIENVMKIMSSYKSTPSEWKKFAKFDRYR